MRSLERHRDVGAYALGVLDEAEAFRFEDHLMECPQCAAQVTEFGHEVLYRYREIEAKANLAVNMEIGDLLALLSPPPSE